MTKRNVYIALALVLVAFFLLGGGAAVVTAVQKGKRLTSSTLGPDGLVVEDPKVLAASAGLPLDVYALARMLRSEGGGGSATEKAARAWVARNDARGFKSVFDCLTYRVNFGKGRFGQQAAGRGRYATTKDPYEDDARIAGDVMAGRIPDLTKGATKFVDKSGFGTQPGTRTYAAVAAEWAKDGYVASTVPGVDPDFVVFRRVT